MEFLLKGIAVGFAVAAPVGPIGVLCIRRTLTSGRIYGFVTGAGAALADTLYGLIAAFGVTLVGKLLIDYHQWIGVGGGVLLIILGILEWSARAPREVSMDVPSTGRLVRGFFTTFMLTLSNPVTILSFAALFAALGIGAAVDEAIEVGHRTSAMVELVTGVFVGSCLWWVLLTIGTNMLRHRIGAAVFRWLNRISGTALIGFGAYALTMLFR
jgi:threonine/homoserine/homoserine lactone efflux protein